MSRLALGRVVLGYIALGYVVLDHFVIPDLRARADRTVVGRDLAYAKGDRRTRLLEALWSKVKQRMRHFGTVGLYTPAF